MTFKDFLLCFWPTPIGFINNSYGKYSTIYSSGEMLPLVFQNGRTALFEYFVTGSLALTQSFLFLNGQGMYFLAFHGTTLVHGFGTFLALYEQ